MFLKFLCWYFGRLNRVVLVHSSIQVPYTPTKYTIQGVAGEQADIRNLANYIFRKIFPLLKLLVF